MTALKTTLRISHYPVCGVYAGDARAPYALSVSFKRPCLLPARLQLFVDSSADAAAEPSKGQGAGSTRIFTVTTEASSATGKPSVLVLEGSVAV